MRRSITNRTVSLTIIILIFAMQIAYEPLSTFAVEIVGSIHQSAINQFLIVATKFISYVVLFGCMGLFLLQIFYVSPHAVENASSLTFLCLTIFINSALKLVFGEIRPYMLGILKDLNVTMYDCETDFGMPSGHVFFGVCFYYLLRMAIFEEMETIDIPQEVANESRKSFVKSLVQPKTAKNRLDQAKFKFFIFEIRMHVFNLVVITYVILLSISRVLAASHYILQVLFGFLAGFSWGWIYFTYLRQPLRSFVHEILAVPSARRKTRRMINLIAVVMFLLTIAIYLVRKIFRNEGEHLKIAIRLKLTCNRHIVLEDKNLLDSLLLWLPIFIFNMYAVLPPKKFINATRSLRPIFWELGKANKLLRFVVLLLPCLFVFLIKLFFDHVIKTFYDHSTIFDYLSMIFILFLFAFLYSVLFPFILDRLGILLRNEYIEDGGSSSSNYLMQDTGQGTTLLHENQEGDLGHFNRTNSIGRDNYWRKTQLGDQLESRGVRTSNLQDFGTPLLNEDGMNSNYEVQESYEREIRLKESKGND